MCRIAGIINPNYSQPQLEAQVQQMCRRQQHGGPDDEGIYSNDRLSLVMGHRRLSVIELSSAGHQPMQYAEKRFTITYNGELYNYQELRKELLMAGCRFNTATDTEVILAAFSAWGTAAFNRFNGMFAFGLLDTETSDFYLVRDGAGIKPLYYSLGAGFLSFASEVRALQLLDECAEERPDWQVYFMAYGHLPEPVTTLANVLPLVKGTYLKYNVATRAHRIETFTQQSFLEKWTDRVEVLGLVRNSLSAAIERQLIADAPLGIFLSGGVDSSIIAAVASKKIGANLSSLSVYFKEKAFSEKNYQDLVLKNLPGNHSRYRITEEDFHQSLPAVAEAMDLPSSDGLNVWMISKKAREAGLTAVLSGLGGDELFGGYPSFNRMNTVARLSNLPAPVLKAGRYSGNKRLRRLAYLSLPGMKGKYLFLRGQFNPSAIARQLDMDEQEVWDILDCSPTLPDVSHLTKKNSASWMEMNLYMQNQLLRDTDVMSMAHGLEVRVPFLDKDFIKVSMAISSPVKYAGEFGKQLLIDAFKADLPEAIWNRPKMGFSFPFKEWLKTNAWAEAAMQQTAHSRHLFEKFKSDNVHWSAIMTLLLLYTHQHARPNPVSYA